MSTTENNKLIAIFRDGVISNTGVVLFPDGTNISIHKLNYHNNWNSLMEVVNQITGDYHRFMTKTDEGQHWTEIWCYEDGVAVHEIECPEDESGTSISSVYAAVLEFIKWYNENKN